MEIITRLTMLRRAGLPFKSVISMMGVACILTGALIVYLVGQAGTTQAVLSLTSTKFHDVGNLMSEQMGRVLEPVQATLRQVSFDPLTTDTQVDERLARAFVLIEELKANPLVTALYVGHASGDFFLARRLDAGDAQRRFLPPADAVYLIQSMSHPAGGAPLGEFIFYDAQLDILERRPQPGYAFDPRIRPWYQAAMQAPGVPALSPPYVFFTTQQIGLTLSQTSRSGGSVIGIDVTLSDLASYLGNLKLTPGTELALLGPDNQVLAYPDMSRVLIPGGDTFDFRKIDDLGAPSLLHLVNTPQGGSDAQDFDAAGQRWLGMTLPIATWKNQGVRLLMSAPYQELTQDISQMQRRTLLYIVIAVLAFLPLGWWGGDLIGRSLGRLTQRTQAIRRFDFKAHTHAGPVSVVREVAELSRDMDAMADTINCFLAISQHLATETDMSRMLQAVLHEVVHATQCVSGAVYLYQDGSMQRNALEGEHCARLPSQFQYVAAQAPRVAPQAGARWLEQVDLELRDRSGQLQGLLVLAHQGMATHADEGFSVFMAQLSGMLAISIETRQLIDAQKSLLDGVVRLMADAVDAKSPYTGGHCQRVPELALLLADQMNRENAGPYSGFCMDAAQRYEFYLGAWLHDCGKVTSPEHIIDKGTKLETIYNRIHEVRMRFEVLWRDAEIAHRDRLLAGQPVDASTATLQARQRELSDDFAYVAQCNIGGEMLADTAVERIERIGAQSWVRHFDNRLGLAIGELRQLEATQPDAPALPVMEPLLSNRPEHAIAWGTDKPPVEKHDPANHYGFDMQLPPHRQNMGELHNLSIRRGTLTAEDRFRINDHVVQTYIMLRNLPWPQSLAKVPEIAATHHERLDGNGYPRRLGASELTTADRIMTLADVFEALTAADRPYKEPKRLSESLRIMALMCKDNHLDAALFRYFLHSDIWRVFAQRHMHPSQIDTVDIAALEALLPA